MAFGSFAELPIPARQTQSRPITGQQHSQPLQQGAPQQQPNQQQLGRRSSGPGPRNSGRAPHYDPHAQSAPSGMHYSPQYNGVPAGSQAYNMQQQPAYYAQGYYGQYPGMMVPQGNYTPPNYPVSQQSNRSQAMPNQFSRPSQPQARSQPQTHQPLQPAAPAAPATKKNKALLIIDPTTQSVVEISPRSKWTKKHSEH